MTDMLGSIILTLKEHFSFDGPRQNILFFGPPGNGKSCAVSTARFFFDYIPLQDPKRQFQGTGMKELAKVSLGREFSAANKTFTVVYNAYPLRETNVYLFDVWGWNPDGRGNYSAEVAPIATLEPITFQSMLFGQVPLGSLNSEKFKKKPNPDLQITGVIFFLPIGHCIPWDSSDKKEPEDAYDQENLEARTAYWRRLKDYYLMVEESEISCVFVVSLVDQVFPNKSLREVLEDPKWEAMRTAWSGTIQLPNAVIRPMRSMTYTDLQSDSPTPSVERAAAYTMDTLKAVLPIERFTPPSISFDDLLEKLHKDETVVKYDIITSFD